MCPVRAPTAAVFSKAWSARSTGRVGLYCRHMSTSLHDGFALPLNELKVLISALFQIEFDSLVI